MRFLLHMKIGQGRRTLVIERMVFYARTIGVFMDMDGFCWHS